MVIYEILYKFYDKCCEAGIYTFQSILQEEALKLKKAWMKVLWTVLLPSMGSWKKGIVLKLPSRKAFTDLFKLTFWPLFFNPLSANPTKWSNTLKQFVDKLPMNCLSMFDHFVKLVLKGLSLPLKLRWIICYLFLTSKLLEKTINSLL